MTNNALAEPINNRAETLIPLGVNRQVVAAGLAVIRPERFPSRQCLPD
jgi:hypothetical protein